MMTEYNLKNPAPWAFMNFDEVVRAGLLPKVKSWIVHHLPPEKAVDYKNYLINFCGFPPNFMAQHQEDAT